MAIALIAIVYVFERNIGLLFFRSEPMYQHLGAEYYNIALALVDGRGFSDPFGEVTGPTAWMPPVFPMLLACLSFVLRDRALVAEAVVWLTITSLSASGVVLFRIARKSGAILPPWLAVAFYVLWLWSFYFWFFFLTHDIWLLLILTTFVVHAIHGYATQNRLSRWRWGILGGVMSLTSPSLAFAWLATTAFIFVRSRTHRRSLVVALVLTCSVAAPWVVRNAWVFHRAIPSKSNLFYEAYQANYRYEGGIYDNTWNEHPNVSPTVRFQYAAAGEAKFIEEHKQKFWSALRAEPGRYVQNVLNRALAATAVHPDAGSYDTPGKMMVRRWVYAVPFVCLIIGLCLRGASLPVLLGLTVFWAAYLVPYVLVAFYLRYIVPLTPCLMLMAFLGADQAVLVATRRWQRRRSQAAPSVARSS